MQSQWHLGLVVQFRVIVLEAQDCAEPNVAVWTVKRVSFQTFLSIWCASWAANDAYSRWLHLLVGRFIPQNADLSGVPDNHQASTSRCLQLFPFRRQILAKYSVGCHTEEISMLDFLRWMCHTVLSEKQTCIPQTADDETFSRSIAFAACAWVDSTWVLGSFANATHRLVIIQHNIWLSYVLASFRLDHRQFHIVDCTHHIFLVLPSKSHHLPFCQACTSPFSAFPLRSCLAGPCNCF